MCVCVCAVHFPPFCHRSLMPNCRLRYKPFHSLHATGWMHWSSWSISHIRFSPPVYLVYGWTIINSRACISLHSSIQFHRNHRCVVGTCGGYLNREGISVFRLKSCAQRMSIMKVQTAVITWYVDVLCMNTNIVLYHVRFTSLTVC